MEYDFMPYKVRDGFGFDCKKCRKKYSDECFYCALDFYIDTIQANPNLLIDFLCSQINGGNDGGRN